MKIGKVCQSFLTLECYAQDTKYISGDTTQGCVSYEYENHLVEGAGTHFFQICSPASQNSPTGAKWTFRAGTEYIYALRGWFMHAKKQTIQN